MPMLPSIRQEKFCRLVLRHGLPAKAYVLAGYTASTPRTAYSNGHRLMKNEMIRARINELRTMTLHKSQVTVDRVLSDLALDRALARESGQFGVSVKATELIAKVTGLLVERRETGQPGDFSGLESREAVLARARNEMGDEAVAVIEALLKGIDPHDTENVPITIDVIPESVHTEAGPQTARKKGR